MKNARPISEASVTLSGAQILPRFPVQTDTAQAQVLADLLAGARPTARDGWSKASTMRAAGAIERLRNKYGWPIQSEDEHAPCADGRVAIVARYSLPADVIATAMKYGGAQWVEKVRKARAALRERAGKAQRIATMKNALKGRLKARNQRRATMEGGRA